MNIKTGFANINGAQLYYEIAGQGATLVMIHAGIADCRMWDNEFDYYSKSHQVLRFDMRGYGKSLPVEGQFNIQDDFATLLDRLNITEPMIIMGCSIGAGLAMEYAITNPDSVQSLILVGGTPRDLELESNDPDELFAASNKAFEAKNLDLVAEIDMQIWFDGIGRDPEIVNKTIRQKAYDMARLVAQHEVKEIGEHVRKPFEPTVYESLANLNIPMLIVVGENDIEYIRLCADYMASHCPTANIKIIPNAAHLPNMEQADIFQSILDSFLENT